MKTTHASFWEAVTGAVQSLRGSKLRSFLTLLGIILATTTLIAVMSVISGMDRLYRRERLEHGRGRLPRHAHRHDAVGSQEVPRNAAAQSATSTRRSSSS